MEQAIDDFTVENGKGPVLEGVGAGRVRQYLPPGHRAAINLDDPERNERGVLRLDRRCIVPDTDKGIEEDGGFWKLVSVWLHEMMHYAMHVISGNEEIDRNAQGKEVGDVFMKGLADMVGGGLDWLFRTPEANIAKKVHKALVSDPSR